MEQLNHRASSAPPSGLAWWAGILPWVVFALTPGWCKFLAAPLALGVFVLLYWRWRRALPPLDAGIGAYFLIYTVLSLTGVDQKMPPRLLFALCPAVLAVTAILSIVLGRPFTHAYALRYAPEHVRLRHSFFIANQIITLIWAVGFTTIAIAVGTLPEEWKPTQAAIIFFSVMGATVAASAITGLWFHMRESRLTT